MLQVNILYLIYNVMNYNKLDYLSTIYYQQEAKIFFVEKCSGSNKWILWENTMSGSESQ